MRTNCVIDFSNQPALCHPWPASRCGDPLAAAHAAAEPSADERPPVNHGLTRPSAVTMPCPQSCRRCIDEVAPKLKIGVRMLSETVRADAREGDIGMQLGEVAKASLRSRSGAIRSSIRGTGRTRMWCRAPAMHIRSRKPNVRSRRCWSECRGHNQAELRSLTAKTGSSP